MTEHSDLKKAFVAGAKWRTEKSCLTWWAYTQRYAEEEAEKRYGPHVCQHGYTKKCPECAKDKAWG